MYTYDKVGINTDYPDKHLEIGGGYGDIPTFRLMFGEEYDWYWDIQHAFDDNAWPNPSNLEFRMGNDDNSPALSTIVTFTGTGDIKLHSTGGGIVFPDGTKLTTASGGGSGPWLTNGTSIYYNTGNTGIGVTSPAFKLHVADRMKLDGDNAGMWIESGTNDWFIGRNGNNLRFYNTGADRVTITPSGNLGIGITSPTEKLEVKGTIKADNIVYNAMIFDSHVNVESVEVSCGSFPEKAIDGNYSDGWQGCDDGNWIIFDCGFAKEMEEIKLHLPASSPPDGIKYVVWGSKDKSSWNSLTNLNPANYSYGVVTEAISGTWRYIKVVVIDMEHWDYFHIYEIELKSKLPNWSSNEYGVYYNGHVGIGSDIVPISKLSIYGENSTANLRFTEYTPPYEGYDVWEIRGNSSLDFYYGFGGSPSNAVLTKKIMFASGGEIYSPKFRDIDNPAFFLDPANTGTSMVVAGQVGIGTTTPQARLDIDGGILRIRGNSSYYTDLGDPKWARLMIDTENSYAHNFIVCKNNEYGVGFLVDGTGEVSCTEVKIKADVWPDFVFTKNYKLKSLAEVEDYIQKNNRLPDVPSQDMVKEEGINVGEMNALLLQKIEELTLYIIELKKENEEQQQLIESMLEE